MNFLKSILSDDQDPPEPEIRRESDPNPPLKQPRDENNPNDVDDGWSFGGLFKTLTMQSESIIEIYRRDLKEFGSGLRQETEILRETASRAVRDLPASLEAAHGALDGVLKSTTNIISKESLGFSSDGESETPGTNRSLNSGRYSRFEAQLSAIQSDLNTFCEEPEDVEDNRKWNLGFELENYRAEIDSLIGENGILEGVYKRIVPSSVDRETFWCRYFYRVDKLKQQESVMANLVRRAISVDDEEELSWDFDDDDDEDDVQNVEGGDGKGDNVASDGNSNPIENNAARDKREGGNVNVSDSEVDNDDDEDDDRNVKGGDGKGDNVASGGKLNLIENGAPRDKPEGGDANVSDVVESSKKSSVDVSLGEKEEKPETVAEEKMDEKVKSKEESVKYNNDEKVCVEEKGESGKKNDASVVSSHQSKGVEEEDLGWDEIEDVGSGDEKRISATTRGGSPKKDYLRKRLSAAGDDDDDDDDLSWDIEDDVMSQ